MISTQTMHGFKSISKTGGMALTSLQPKDKTLKEASKSSGTPFHRQITNGSDKNQTLSKMRGSMAAVKTGTSWYSSAEQQKIQEQMQMEELQKQLVRIFGDTVQIQPNEDGSSPLLANSPDGKTNDEEIDIIQQMREKPATPLLRQRTLERGPLPVIKESVESVPGARSTEDDIQQLRANKRFQNHRDEIALDTQSSILEEDLLSENSD